ncbi:hypothetical protein [Pseudanabaena minima]
MRFKQEEWRSTHYSQIAVPLIIAVLSQNQGELRREALQLSVVITGLGY